MGAGKQTQSSRKVAKEQVKTCGYKKLHRIFTLNRSANVALKALARVWHRPLQGVGNPRFSIGAHPMKSLVALRPAETCRTLIEKAAEAALVFSGFSEELE